MSYPEEFKFLRPFAKKCDLVGNSEDCKILVRNLDGSELQQLVDLYINLVDAGAKPRLDDWLENCGVTKASSEVHRLLVLLDYLARNDYIPQPQASTLFIEWDDRDFDDDGNEW